MQTYIVTGASGFLGSHLTDRLLDEGYQVIGVDNFITGRLQNLRKAQQSANFTFIEADVSQPVDQYLKNVTIDELAGIFHLASPASPPHYQAKPVETYLVNSLATHYLLTFLKEKYPQARFLFASTSEVYGDPEQHPQTEKYWGNVNPNGIRSCYDESKRLGESICGVFERDFSLDVRIMRIFNTYGPRINPADKRVVPEFISLALSGKPLSVFGEGQQTRSFCYVDDLIEGMWRLMSRPNLKGKTINLGNPNEITVKELAEILIETINPDLTITYKPLPKDDPTRRKPDISLAHELLDWQPKINLNEGLEATIKFFKENEATS